MTLDHSCTAHFGGALLLAVLLGCSDAPERPSAPSTPIPDAATSDTATSDATALDKTAHAPDDPGLFTEEAAARGLDFVHFNGMSGELYYSEMMGSGVALFDADNDGDLDVYLVQGHLLGDGKTLDDATFPPPSDAPPGDRFYRNELVPSGELRFTDLTVASGLSALGYGMGAVAFDADRDGFVDLYVTNEGPNQLWRNRGPDAEGVPTFEDISDASGTAVDSWSVPAIPFDADGDGWLDLFVGNYLDYDVTADKPCRDELGQRNYCGPLSYPPQTDRLLLNRGVDAGGQVTFEDITEASGLGSEAGGCLGAVAADFNDDGRLDLYVANDGTPNFLWIQEDPVQNGRADTLRFTNRALLSGLAISGQGHPEASMGTAAADFDGDGDRDLLITHLDKETNTLYRNDGQGFFTDASQATGVGPPSLPLTGFGTAFLDVDLDGWLDLLAVNGAVKVIKALAMAGDPLPLHQPNLLLRNRGESANFEVIANALPFSEVSRGAAVGDLDNDGDSDVVISNNSGPVRLLLNRTISASKPGDARWLGVHLHDTDGHDVPTARAELRLDDGRTLVRWVETAGSYASSHDPRLLFGLGNATPESLRVTWPDGRHETWNTLQPGAYQTVRQGTGISGDTP